MTAELASRGIITVLGYYLFIIITDLSTDPAHMSLLNAWPCSELAPVSITYFYLIEVRWVYYILLMNSTYFTYIGSNDE
jgi:hypothetical protein